MTNQQIQIACANQDNISGHAKDAEMAGAAADALLAEDAEHAKKSNNEK